jgi:hypothetical protein
VISVDNWNNFLSCLESYKVLGHTDKYYTEDRATYINKLLSVCDQHTKLFKIDDKLVKLLCLTKNSLKDSYFLPFDSMFIDCELKLSEQQSIKGFLIQKYKTWVKPEQRLRMDVEMVGFVEDITKPNKFIFFNYPLTNIGTDEIVNLFNFDKPKHKDIQLFAVNVIDFLNNPEVELVNVERTEEQNRKRILRGKKPIPPQNFVRVTGKLKIYLDQLCSGKEFHYSHSFWVRGHFRTLRSEKWKEKRGTKIWIPPYIKGKGILIDKYYNVEKDKEVSLASSHT